MAVPRVYKSITSHQMQCEFAEKFMTTYRQDLGSSLTDVFRKDTPEGEPVVDVLPFADALLLRLRGAFDGLLQAEEKHLNELANDAQFRTLRDDAAAFLRRTLVDLRGLFRSSFGFDMAEAVGFEREIAQNPAALLRQTERLLANLSRPDLELPPSRYEGVEVTPASIVAQVEPRAEALRKALNDVTQELSNVQGTQVVKDEALEAFRQTYVLFLRILQGSFRLAGKQELARRLRRAIRRSAQNRTEVEPVEPEPEEGEGETPAPDADPSGVGGDTHG